ncbi:MAG: pitrilysin family protein [bacterium]|nr:pitrilysin family protein [bacterium]
MPNKTYYKKVYPNGLTLLTVPIESAASVTMSVFVKAGSRYEEAKLNGISHYLEHVHFKGTKKYPTTKKLSEAVDAIGGEFNANTGKEHTQYYIQAAHQHLPIVFDVLTELIKNPLFDEKELEREKGVIIEEINMYKDNPQIHVEALFEETLWPKTPLGRDIAGTAEVVRSITRKNVINYRTKWYQPSNTIIAVAGKFDQEKLEKYVQRSWAKSKNKKIGSIKPVVEKQFQPRLSIQNKVTEQAHMIVGFKSYKYKDKNNYPLRVLSAILGGGLSSRMFIQIRERKGLAYYVATSVENYLDTGTFFVRSGLKISSAPKALDMILAELRKVRDRGITRAELKKAKEQIKGRMSLGLENAHEKLDWYLGQEAFVGKIKSLEKTFADLEKVSLKDVHKVAKDLIRNDRLNVAIIGPFKDRSVFEKRLKL